MLGTLLSPNSTTKNVLTAKGLGVLRGDRVLFKAIDLDVAPGDCLLLRGANGAGKTTLLRTLAGFVRPETGTVEASPFHWLGHKTGLKPHETPALHLKVWSDAWGSSAELPPILERLGLKRCADVAAASLSAGQKRRTGFARLQLTKRPLWLLDEPFSAIDTKGKTLIAELIDEHIKAGGAVIAAVHGDVPIAGRELSL